MGALVLGLDLSLTATGICDWRGETSVIRPAAVGDARLMEIRDRIVMASGGVQLAVIEDMLVRSFTAPFTGMVHGAVRAVLMDLGVPYVLVPPTVLKKFATGKGTADKTAMAIAAFKRFGREFRDDNQCDAFWLRAMGLCALDGEGAISVVPLPAAQIEQLDRVTWPVPIQREVG